MLPKEDSCHEGKFLHDALQPTKPLFITEFFKYPVKLLLSYKLLLSHLGHTSSPCSNDT